MRPSLKEVFTAYELKYWFVAVACLMSLSMIVQEWVLPLFVASCVMFLVGGYLSARRLEDFT